MVWIYVPISGVSTSNISHILEAETPEIVYNYTISQCVLQLMMTKRLDTVKIFCFT